MANPLLGLMSRNNSLTAIQQAMQTVNLIRQTGNPETVINQMAQNNPNIKKAMDICTGKNPKEVFENGCKQAGINPDQLFGMIK